MISSQNAVFKTKYILNGGKQQCKYLSPCKISQPLQERLMT